MLPGWMVRRVRKDLSGSAGSDFVNSGSLVYVFFPEHHIAAIREIPSTIRRSILFVFEVYPS
jgi:hypothetical protein